MAEVLAGFPSIEIAISDWEDLAFFAGFAQLRSKDGGQRRSEGRPEPFQAGKMSVELRT
jgi:hypothetical protein